ncbi:solute carrier family 9 (sodium/hydrogen exchanger), member 8 [Marchantia polymorpha subsp. ruderalis]|uniref:Sodium/hydrogen exchanger n=2 Tax=Marchantia polymorpha TaxID=3197 RepID=A0AAF6BKP6_MARPO|nr:hypothetical protein MARPO_0058s0105 [Marchantia polymorpha]BBN12580.1 hypothetical protein Mp_5g21230 [Marchantia polymorpha subsp. ruderalis]|eukprot:PTQ37340.1 hypothetical protein MARPO_0058s0105 [Marchantia polymorpha]
MMKAVILAYPGRNFSLSVQEDEQPAYVASVSILVQIFMLGCTFVIGHVLRRNKIMIVHEAGAALILGVFVGMAVRISGEESGFSSWINFNNQFFFYFLLPPIIFESGWSLKTRPFFGNFGAICTFAFLGTLVSTFVTGICLWIFGSLKLTHAMPFMVCLTFGALISATDPVTVLALFNELGVDANLYAYVFGESVLNDAVAIVLYRTLLSFVGTEISKGGIFGAFSYFIANFIGSFSIGVICALGSALLVKYGGLNDHGLGVLESCLMVLFPYASYMMADALELSGIVAILFCGITMKYYTAPLMSSVAQTITTSFFQMLAKLSETFVFIYMGVAMFLEQQSWNNIGFTFFTIISILIGRALNVYPCSIIVNKYREKPLHIPRNQQHALWYSGLRGAMAFALALQSVTDLPDNHGRVLLTSTLFTIFFTVLLVGGSTPFVLTYLKIEMSGPSEGHDAPEPSEPMPPSQRVETPVQASDDESEDDARLGILERQKAKLQRKLRRLKSDANFVKLDKKYIKPFFASPVGSDPTSPTSPVVDKGTSVKLVTLPARTHERRSLIADAFHARSETVPTPGGGTRKASRLASYGQQEDTSWIQPPPWPSSDRRPSGSQKQDTWAEPARVPSVPSRGLQTTDVWSQKPDGPDQEKTKTPNAEVGEKSWPSSGGWPSRTAPTDPWTQSLAATVPPQKSLTSKLQSSSWNKANGGGGDNDWLHSTTGPSKQSSHDLDFATIDLT